MGFRPWRPGRLVQAGMPCSCHRYLCSCPLGNAGPATHTHTHTDTYTHTHTEAYFHCTARQALPIAMTPPWVCGYLPTPTPLSSLLPLVISSTHTHTHTHTHTLLTHSAGHISQPWNCREQTHSQPRFICLVTQLCPTLCNPMDCSPPGSSIHRISQARILQWVPISFSTSPYTLSH